VPIGVSALTRTGGNRALVLVSEIVLVLLVAGWLTFHGAHALLSGSAGDPSPLQNALALGLIAAVGLGVLAWLWRASRVAMLACVFLFGSTVPGYLLSTYLIAPLIANGASHDTAPWTETVVAAWTSAAGVTMLFAALAAVRRVRSDGAAQLAALPQESG
jgi:hypothetical protein